MKAGIISQLIEAPFGVLEARFEEKGRLSSLTIRPWKDEQSKSDFQIRQKTNIDKQKSSADNLKSSNVHVKRRMAQLRLALEDPERARHPGVFLDDLTTLGTPFQRRVWRALLQIPHGETRSYSEIAQRLGCSEAVRAVANAIAANPYHYLLPCHRVVQKNGNLGGFAAGVETKRMLLKNEGICL